MKFKHLFQVLTLLALTFSLLGTSQPAQAAPAADPVIVTYNLAIWNATYSGMVDATRYEQWNFSLTETTSFVVTATILTGDLIPLITLSGGGLSGSGIPGQGSVTATLPAGNYSVLIKPQSGSGTYSFTLRLADTSSAVVLNPASIKVGETSTATVGLSAVPATGYTSAEFTCTYDHTLVEVSSITDAGLFGTDAVMVVNGPANGTFIVAIAGSVGKKATTSGSVFTFKAKGLQAGSAVIDCDARVSTGNSTLTEVASAPATLTITDPTGTLSGVVHAAKLVDVCFYNDDTNTDVTCVEVDDNGAFSVELDAGNYIVTASAEGFLSAEGSATVTAGAETAMPDISLLAGDIDGDGDVDNYDAMTIGMNYNLPTPAAADLNNDANIDVLDLELLAANYHATAPTAWE